MIGAIGLIVISIFPLVHALLYSALVNVFCRLLLMLFIYFNILYFKLIISYFLFIRNDYSITFNVVVSSGSS